MHAARVACAKMRLLQFYCTLHSRTCTSACATRQFFLKKTPITRIKLFFHLPGGHQNQQATSKTTASQSISQSAAVSQSDRRVRRETQPWRDTTTSQLNNPTQSAAAPQGALNHTVCRVAIQTRGALSVWLTK